jgi:quinol monooxygenase YgiN
MSLLVLLELEAKPGKADELVDLLRVSLRDTRARQGCISVSVHRDQAHADRVLLVEEWATREDDEAYRTWRAGEGATPEVGALIAGPPTLRYFDNVDA